MSYGPRVPPAQGRALVEAALDRNKASAFQKLAKQCKSWLPSVIEPTSGLNLAQCCVLSGSIDSGDQATRLSPVVHCAMAAAVT
jgi:hypothetical protein